MRAKLTIKNYRCFLQPATIEIAKGFTAFVGVNNAGKSVLMRFLLELRNLFSTIGINQHFHRSLLDNQRAGINLLHVTDSEEIFSNRNNDPINFWFDFIYDERDATLPRRNYFPDQVRFELSRNLQWKTEVFRAGSRIVFPSTPNHNPEHLIQSGSTIFQASPLIEIANTLARTLYVGPFRNTINIGTNENYLDIKIGQAFITQFRDLKTGPSKKNSAGISALTESIRKIFGFESLDIVPSTDNTSLHITINGKPYKQHELGSGIAQFIVVLANAATSKPKILLIDEPELNLHPSLQLDFLTTLGNYVEEGVWYSTHSLGLARSSAERVYSVTKQSDGDSVVKPLEGTPRYAEMLGEMNYGSYKALGFDKILLVEGPTEVKVIQHFLRSIGKEHQIVLLPMHGSWPDEVELSEISRITPNIAALIDSERTSESASIEPRRAAFLNLCRDKNIKAHALQFRATENYFTDRAVKEVFGDSYRGLQPYERLRDIQPNWSKSHNW
jgi:ABC-type cobalamin/Fe3+-siderophores transport system ATPase subunit